MRCLVNLRRVVPVLGGVICWAILFFPTGNLLAQTEFSGLPEPGEPVFDLDWAAFRIPGDSVRLEIYYRITNPHLSYVKKGNQYAASYEISAILKGRGDEQAATASNRENYVLETFDETRRTSGFLINILAVRVVPGQYELVVTVNDRISGGTHTVHRAVDIHDQTGPDWVIGGPEFVIPGVAPPADPRFQKDTSAFVPNVTRSLGGNDQPLSLYFEIYQPAHHPASSVVITLIQQAGHHYFTDTIRVDTALKIIPVFYQKPIPGFETGDARMELVALDHAGRKAGAPFSCGILIDWSLASMVANNWKDVVDMLVHIASRQELDSLRKVAAPDREAAFDQFWHSKDPSPGSDANEWKEEYYRRVRFANQQFTNPFQPGWRTDFGTVYIRYGEPDDVERYPFELDSKPYEIWHYYAQRRQFTFIDTKGNGEYDLQYPYDGIIR